MPQKSRVPSGAGFGKKKQSQPNNQADSGHSSSYAEIVTAVSEGQIEGPILGAQSIYLNQTPVENPDGSNNFPGFSWDWRNGTNFQSRIPGYADAVASETNVGVEVKNPIPITRTIINRNLDAIRIRIGVQLQEFDPEKGARGLNVAFRIYIKEGAGAFVLRLDENISGRYSSLTEFEWYFPVNNAGGTVDQFQVRIERVTGQDANSDRYVRQVSWRTFTEVIEIKLRYPNTALFALKFDATHFDSTPEIAFKIAGRTVQIPTNAIVQVADRGLLYTGLWNGTFYTPAGACADPAWILYDLLTNERYGLGKYIKLSNIDKWSFYQISQYCNEIVPDGFGGLERRFLCNVVIDGKEEAARVIDNFRSIFRGFSYYMSGAVYMVADMPASPVAQFTQADIEDGMFSYSRSALKARHTVALVTWIDPNDFYQRAVETVEDPEGIELYGYRVLEISAFACTSRGQARRAGLAALISERIETETVTFRARAISVYTKPGDIIKIADPKRAQVRYGGLIAAATKTTITLDAPVALTGGTTYLISVLMPDGGIQERQILSAGNVSTVALNAALPEAPNPEANWIISEATITPQLFRVLNRVPVSGQAAMTHEITAVEYRPDKFNNIEQGWSLTPLPTRQVIPKVTNPPRSVRLSLNIISGVFSLQGAWDYPVDPYTLDRDQFQQSYLVETRVGANGEWQNTRSTRSLTLDIATQTEDTYYLRVAAIDITGNASAWVESSGVFVGYVNAMAIFNQIKPSAFFALLVEDDMG